MPRGLRSRSGGAGNKQKQPHTTQRASGDGTAAKINAKVATHRQFQTTRPAPTRHRSPHLEPFEPNTRKVCRELLTRRDEGEPAQVDAQLLPNHAQVHTREARVQRPREPRSRIFVPPGVGAGQTSRPRQSGAGYGNEPSSRRRTPARKLRHRASVHAVHTTIGGLPTNARRATQASTEYSRKKHKRRQTENAHYCNTLGPPEDRRFGLSATVVLASTRTISTQLVPLY